MSPNEHPNDRLAPADATNGYWQRPVARRGRAALDVPAERPSLLGQRPSNSVAVIAADRLAQPRLESPIDQVDDSAVFVLDEHGHVWTWNDGVEELTGYARAEILGEHVSMLYHPVEAGKPKRILRSVTEERITERGWLVCADGSTFRAETTVRPLRENGSLTGYVIVVQNVTDQDRERELLDCSTTLAEEGARIAEPEPVELREVAEAAWDVTVRVGPLPSWEGFYVEDDGPGIPADERDQVFESGYSTTDEGTGFGLAIVRTIAEAHDWSIQVTEGRAGGARFEIATTG